MWRWPTPPVKLTSIQHLGYGKKRRVWDVARHVIPQSYRFFYEGHPAIEGQLWFHDRRLVYESVRRFRPETCFEVGTWTGGGSTLFISAALKENRKGILHSVEIEKHLYEKAVRNYQSLLPEMLPFVNLYLGDYRKVFSPVLEERGVDFFMLDGPEDADINFEQFDFFDAYSEPSTVLIAHDWNTEKCRLLRPHLEKSTRWEIDTIIDTPRSVGIVRAICCRSR